MNLKFFSPVRAVGLLLAAFAFLGVSCVPAMEGEDAPARVPPAQRVDPPVTPITAPAVAAEQNLSTEDYLGQVVLLDFWATWSEQGLAELSNVAELHAEFSQRGFTAVGLAVEHGELEHIRAKMAGLEFAYPAMIISVDELRAYGSRSIPTRVLLDQQGEVVEVFSGALSFEELRERIAGLLTD